MEALGGTLVVLGVIVFPLLMVVGLIKPKLVSDSLKKEVGRKEIGLWGLAASFVVTGIGAVMLPPVDETVQADTVVQTEAEAKTTVAETEVAAEMESTEETQTPLPDFGMTTDEFVKNYNDMVMQIDQNWIINSVKDGQSIHFAPMPDNASMSGVVADNGNLRGLIVGLSGSKDPNDSMQTIALCLAAANAVNPNYDKEKIAKVVTEIIPESINTNSLQSAVVGDVKYGANFSPSLGGLFFTIDAQ